jgi:hypothetical protein
MNMKLYKFIAAITLLMGLFVHPGLGQDPKPELSLYLTYYNRNNKLQYLQATAKSKIEGKFQPVTGLHLQFFITDEQASHSLGKSVTNEKGIAILFIPPAAKEEWIKSETRGFIIRSEPTALYDSTVATAEVTKSKINIDTGADKKIIATLLALKNGAWVPVSGVDLVLAVKRMGGDLLVDQNPTHTTDSLGVASVDFSIPALPGDSAGNITLIAKVEDNDLYGNLTSERSVPWGTQSRYVSDFGKRSLFARGGRSPFWLIFLAYSIGLSVWGVIFYLALQIRKIKRLGA